MRLTPRSENRDRSAKGIDWELVHRYNIAELLPENPIDTYNKLYHNYDLELQK